MVTNNEHLPGALGRESPNLCQSQIHTVVIIIGLEYGEYYSREIDIPTVLTTVENYKQLWEFVSFTDYPRIFQGYISNYGITKIDRYLHGAEPSQGVYSRAAFNEYGDIEYERP